MTRKRRARNLRRDELGALTIAGRVAIADEDERRRLDLAEPIHGRRRHRDVRRERHAERREVAPRDRVERLRARRAACRDTAQIGWSSHALTIASSPLLHGGEDGAGSLALVFRAHEAVGRSGHEHEARDAIGMQQREVDRQRRRRTNGRRGARARSSGDRAGAADRRARCRPSRTRRLAERPDVVADDAEVAREHRELADPSCRDP